MIRIDVLKCLCRFLNSNELDQMCKIFEIPNNFDLMKKFTTDLDEVADFVIKNSEAPVLEFGNVQGYKTGGFLIKL